MRQIKASHTAWYNVFPEFTDSLLKEPQKAHLLSQAARTFFLRACQVHRVRKPIAREQKIVKERTNKSRQGEILKEKKTNHWILMHVRKTRRQKISLIQREIPSAVDVTTTKRWRHWSIHP